MPTTPEAAPARGRWLVGSSAVLFQLALGAVYAWSVFSKALQKPGSDFHLTKAQAALPFSVTIGMIFLGTYLAGPIPGRPRPRIMALTGGFPYSPGAHSRRSAPRAVDHVPSCSWVAG